MLNQTTMQTLRALLSDRAEVLSQIAALKVEVDRIRAAELGLSQRDVANSMLISLSSSGLVAPSFFLNPANNVNYTVAVQTPIARLASVPSLLVSVDGQTVSIVPAEPPA